MDNVMVFDLIFWKYCSVKRVVGRYLHKKILNTYFVDNLMMFD